MKVSQIKGRVHISAHVHESKCFFLLLINFMHQSIPTVPIPSRADPRELGFFQNKLANDPPPGQNSCSNAPGWWLKDVLFSSSLVLLAVKSELIQAKLSPSWVLFPVVSAKIGHSTALASHFMSYRDVFNKKLTV